MEPAIDNRIGRRNGVFPIASHHVLALDDDLAALTIGHLIAFRIADLELHRADNAARRTEDGMPRSIGADDRRCLRETVTLEHRYSDSVVIALQLDVEECATAYEELHSSAHALTNSLENEFVKQRNQRFFPKLAESAGIPIFLVVGDGEAECKIVERLHFRAFLLDGRFDILLEIARQSRNGEHHMRPHLGNRHGDVLERSERVFAYRHGSDGATVRHHRVESGYVRKAVVERKDDEHHVALVNANHRMGLLYVGRVIAVGEENAFGVGCGAGGVRYIGVVIRPNRLIARLERIGMFLQIRIAHCLQFGNEHLLLL